MIDRLVNELVNVYQQTYLDDVRDLRRVSVYPVVNMEISQPYPGCLRPIIYHKVINFVALLTYTSHTASQKPVLCSIHRRLLTSQFASQSSRSHQFLSESTS